MSPNNSSKPTPLRGRLNSGVRRYDHRGDSMSLVTCAECNTEISSTAKSCPKCGAVPAGKSAGRKVLFVILAIVAVLIFLMALGSSPEAQEKARERSAIDLCWSDYEKKSLDSGTKRFVASTCEHMETEFRNKHGVSP